MLTIHRVPTLLSLNQDDNTSCGKKCLNDCCIPGARLPLYAFGRRYCIKPKRVRSFGDLHTVPDIIDASLSDDSSDSDSGKSILDTLILAEWEDRSDKGLFRYDVTACETKTLPGEYGFIAQLNEGRHLKKRPTEFRVDQVLQDFDSGKFNFTKVGQEEALFRFEESEDGFSEFYEFAKIRGSPNVVVINVSPIEYGHVLLVPRVLDRIPQRIDADTFLLALHMAVEVDNPYFRLGYNSLGAFATINHLHFQAYYLTAPFPVERAPTEMLSRRKRKRTVKVFELKNYPVRGLVFELGSSLEELALLVAGASAELQASNIPFNILIADRGARVFLFPQCYAERQARNEVDLDILETQVNPAVWEISGHIVLKRKEDYEVATQAYAWRLLSEVSLQEDRFKEVKQLCLDGAEKAVDNWDRLLPSVTECNVAEQLAGEDKPVCSTTEKDSAKHAPMEDSAKNAPVEDSSKNALMEDSAKNVPMRVEQKCFLKGIVDLFELDDESVQAEEDGVVPQM
eukprot:TRINITY_DN1182_c1_g1_i2.p1 TRINITY_DN1182_c1_g1~~TRINITY_DN1182_c1_g1_i2.p1  ORF type:complete len:513 (-),score=102.55 TRINITY_DN1182_c1_g1_i2:373-1911(-)